MHTSTPAESVCIEFVSTPVERFSERLNSIFSADNTDASSDDTERLHAKPLADNRQSVLSFYYTETSCVFFLAVRAPAKTDTNKYFIRGNKRVCKLHVLYERKMIGTG